MPLRSSPRWCTASCSRPSPRPDRVGTPHRSRCWRCCVSRHWRVVGGWDAARWFVLAGALAGLAQYTYPSARLLPVWLIVIALLDLVVQRGQRRAVLIDYALAAFTAAIVFLPLGVFFIQNPQWLFERAQQTSAAIDLGQNMLKTLLGFVVQGSTENLHNLPGRPLLDPVLGFFFIDRLERECDQASRRSRDFAERCGDSIAGGGVDRSSTADAPLDGGLSAGGDHRRDRIDDRHELDHRSDADTPGPGRWPQRWRAW